MKNLNYLVPVFNLLLLLHVAVPTSAQAQQYMIYSEQCSAGNGEAQNYFRQAQDSRFGRDVSLNAEFAQSRYNEALLNGSARAMVDLGTMAEELLAVYPNSVNYKESAMGYFKQAAEQGCPEAMYKLYLWDEYENPGVNKEFPHSKLLEAANGGAMIAMYDLGNQYFRTGNTEAGMEWMEKALKLGYGDAAVPYSRQLFAEGRNKAGVEALLQGAQQGSIMSLKRLAWIYSRGRYNQIHDPEYADCLMNVASGIKTGIPPEPIRHLDKMCPAPTIMIY